MKLKQTSSQKGFTLIEVLVALTIVAVSLPALMFSISTQVNQLTYVEQKLMGQWVASNEVAKLNTLYRQSGVVNKGKKSGTELMANQRWSWVYRSSEEKNLYAKGIYTVDIDVFTEEQKENPIISFSYSYFDTKARVANLVELAKQRQQSGN